MFFRIFECIIKVISLGSYHLQYSLELYIIKSLLKVQSPKTS